jgi:hypothetical protein
MIIVLVLLALLALLAAIAVRAYRARTRTVPAITLPTSPYEMPTPVRPVSHLRPGFSTLISYLVAVLLPVGLVYLFSPSSALHLLPIWAGVLLLTYLLPYLSSRRTR